MARETPLMGNIFFSGKDRLRKRRGRPGPPGLRPPPTPLPGPRSGGAAATPRAKQAARNRAHGRSHPELVLVIHLDVFQLRDGAVALRLARRRATRLAIFRSTQAAR